MHRFVLLLGLLAAFARAQDAPRVAPVPDGVRESFRLAPFYEKHVDAGGLPIVSSARVRDAALLEMRYLVMGMVGHRPEILATLGKAGVRFSIMAHDEYTTDIPEHSHLKPAVYWDRRARGLGATRRAPSVSAGEENLLAFPGDSYPREIIGLHEFAHAIHGMAMNELDPTFDARLKTAYESALASGKWKGTYAAVNREEYWAEASQAWFDNNAANDALHNEHATREKLKAYDPTVAALCAEVYGDRPWRYRKPSERPAAERAHLAAFDPASAPRFHWRKVPVPDRPRVSVQCKEGELELEFQPGADPSAMAQFLELVQLGAYSSGSAVFGSGEIALAPSATTPAGDPIPEGGGRYALKLAREDEPAPGGGGGFVARIVKGAALLPKIVEASGAAGLPIQRIVRLN